MTAQTRTGITQEVTSRLASCTARELMLDGDPYAADYHERFVERASVSADAMIRDLCSLLGGDPLPAMSLAWATSESDGELHVAMRIALTLARCPEAAACRPLLERPWPRKLDKGGVFGEAVVSWMQDPRIRVELPDLHHDESLAPGMRIRMELNAAWESGAETLELTQIAGRTTYASALVRRRELLKALHAPRDGNVDRAKLNLSQVESLDLPCLNLLTRWPDLWSATCDPPIALGNQLLVQAKATTPATRSVRSANALADLLSAQDVRGINRLLSSKRRGGPNLQDASKHEPTSAAIASILRTGLRSQTVLAAKRMQGWRQDSAQRWQPLRPEAGQRLESLAPGIAVPAHWTMSATAIANGLIEKTIECTPSLLAAVPWLDATWQPAEAKQLLLCGWAHLFPANSAAWSLLKPDEFHQHYAAHPQAMDVLKARLMTGLDASLQVAQMLADLEASSTDPQRLEFWRKLPAQAKQTLTRGSRNHFGTPAWDAAYRAGCLAPPRMKFLADMLEDGPSKVGKENRKQAVLDRLLDAEFDCEGLGLLLLRLPEAEERLRQRPRMGKWIEQFRQTQRTSNAAASEHPRPSSASTLPTPPILLRPTPAPVAPTKSPSTPPRARSKPKIPAEPLPPDPWDTRAEALDGLLGTPASTSREARARRAMDLPGKPNEALALAILASGFRPRSYAAICAKRPWIASEQALKGALKKLTDIPQRSRAYFEILLAVGVELANPLAIVTHLCRRGDGAGHRLDHAYKQHTLPKKSGGTRTISAPSPLLKRVQREIYDKLLQPLGAHPASFGFVEGASIVHNAQVHVGQPIVANVDVANCFPSVRWQLVLGALRRNLSKKLGSPAISLLCDICTAFGALPIGAPTSPALLNLVLRRTDEVLAAAAKKRKCRYTRYADDLTFSGDHGAVKLLGIARRTLAQIGLALDDKKTQIYRRGRRQMVTGLVVNEQVSVPRRIRRRLRAAVHSIALGRQPHWRGNADVTPDQIRGQVAYLQMVHAEEAERLRDVLSQPRKQPDSDETPQDNATP